MAKGKFRGAPGGMGNMNSMMKQVQKMQREMEKKQRELEEKQYTATAGGGAVKVTVDGKRVVQELQLSEAVVDPDDIDMLQDLIMVALNDVLKQVEDDAASSMGQMTGGMNIPGLF
ncbi:MAG: YbaB/EbfC family nucleoid-associated protein [Clostridiales bacterium]|nr:MAG: YbaB/EbfC family nucleoid-associated protein [Clostridiales bacterium]